MKKIFFACFYVLGFVFPSTNSVAQTTEEKQPKKIKEPKDRIVVDLNYDGWLNIPQGIAQKAFSIGGNAYFIWDYPVGYGPFSIAFGGGISTHNVHSNGRVTYSVDGNYTSLTPLTTPYKKNKLSCNYFEVPLELRMRTGNGHKFKMAFGGKIGYLYNIHTKEVDDDGKRKVYWIKNVNPWRYGVTFRIGYDKINLQGFYSLSELFLKGKGEPNVIPYSLGIGLLLY